MPLQSHVCISFEEDLSAFLDGELAPERAAEVEAHLEGCSLCTSRVASLGQADAALRALDGPSVDAPLERRLRQGVAARLRSEADAGRRAPRRRWRGRATVIASAIAMPAALLAGILILPGLEEQVQQPGAPVEATELLLADASEEELAIALELETLEDLELIEALDWLEGLDFLDEPRSG